jgi:hypothetical protein
MQKKIAIIYLIKFFPLSNLQNKLLINFLNNMKNDQKGFVRFPVLIMIVLGIIILGAGTYFVVHQNIVSQAPAYQDQTNTTDNTQTDANASSKTTQQPMPNQTFTYGKISFQYPSEWVAKVIEYGGDATTKGNWGFVVYKKVNKEGNSLDEIKSDFEFVSNCNPYSGLEPQNAITLCANLDNGNGYIYPLFTKSKDPATLTVFDQIVKTATILSTDTSNWKTYSDDVLGVSFQYPDSLGIPNQVQLSTSNRVSIGASTSSQLSVSNGVYYNQTLQRNSTLQEMARPIASQISTHTTIDGRDAYILKGASTGIAEDTAYIQSDGDVLVTIDYSYYFSNDNGVSKIEPKGEDTFNKILSTLKFIQTPVTAPVICSATEHSCPCATGNYCLFRGGMCLNPTSACPLSH